MQTLQRAPLLTLLALLLGFGLMQMGNTLQGTLLSVGGGIEGFSPAQVGAVGAGFWGLYRQSPFGLVSASLCGVTTSAFFRRNGGFSAPWCSKNSTFSLRV